MSILNFEVPAEAQTPTNKPISLTLLCRLWMADQLTNKTIKTTLECLRESGHTHLRIGNLERSRQLFMRLMQYKISWEVLDKFWGIIEQVIEEGLEINDENTKKINYLLGEKYKVSKSAIYFVVDSFKKGTLTYELEQQAEVDWIYDNLKYKKDHFLAREGDLL